MLGELGDPPVLRLSMNSQTVPDPSGLPAAVDTAPAAMSATGSGSFDPAFPQAPRRS